MVLESFVGVGSALRGCWVRLVGGVGNGSLSSTGCMDMGEEMRMDRGVFLKRVIPGARGPS